MDLTALLGSGGPNMDPKNLRQVYDFLDRKARHLDLRPSQVEALDLLTASRAQKDLVLKLSTGGGKTLIGMVFLWSHMKETDRPGVYLCATKQLAEQAVEEAREIGILAHFYNSTHPSAECTAGDAVVVCTYDKLFNSKTTFDRQDVHLRPVAMVLDDAHAGIEIIRQRFTLKLTGDPLNVLKSLLSSPCNAHDAAKWLSIQNEDPEARLEVPYWIWSDLANEVRAGLYRFGDDDEFMFKWGYLTGLLRWCRCIISGKEAEIVPEVMPVHLVKAFNECPHRLFMSGTLADDSVLVRDLGVDQATAAKPLTLKEDRGPGERLILVPGLIDPKIQRAIIMNWCKAASARCSVVVLCPTKKRAKEWEKLGAKVGALDEVDPMVAELKKGTLKFCAFPQRYDGIDLADDACRILVLDGMPTGEGLTDRLDSEKLESPGGARNRLIYRIEQGMGRAVRSPVDFAVVVLLGPELATFVAKKDVVAKMSNTTKAQLALARELAKYAQTTQTSAVEAMKSLSNQCLGRQAVWKQLYEQKVRSVANDAAPPDLVAIDMAQGTRQAFYAAANNHSARAIEITDKLLAKPEHAEDQAWLIQQKANFMCDTNRGEAMAKQRAAHDKNPSLFRPSEGFHKRPRSLPNETSIKRFQVWMQQFDDTNGPLAALESQRAKLSFGLTAKQVEAGIAELAALLGAEASRPENESNPAEGPDVLWLWDGVGYVIEVKSEAATLRKEDGSGQLLNSIEWFKKTYPTMPFVPVTITNAAKFTANAQYPPETVAIGEPGLERLLENIANLLRALAADTSIITDAARINVLKNSINLTGPQLGVYAHKLISE